MALRRSLRQDDFPGFVWLVTAVIWSLVIGLAVTFGVRHWLAATLGLRLGPLGQRVIEGTINRAAIGIGVGMGLGVLAVLTALFVVRSSETRAFQWIWHAMAVASSIVVGAALAYGGRHWLAATLRLPAGPLPPGPLEATISRAALGMGAAGGLALLAVLTGFGALRGWLAARVTQREEVALRERAHSAWQQEIERLAAQAELGVAARDVDEQAPAQVSPAGEGISLEEPGSAREAEAVPPTRAATTDRAPEPEPALEPAAPVEATEGVAVGAEEAGDQATKLGRRRRSAKKTARRSSRRRAGAEPPPEAPPAAAEPVDATTQAGPEPVDAAGGISTEPTEAATEAPATPAEAATEARATPREAATETAEASGQAAGEPSEESRATPAEPAEVSSTTAEQAGAPAAAERREEIVSEAAQTAPTGAQESAPEGGEEATEAKAPRRPKKRSKKTTRKTSRRRVRAERQSEPRPEAPEPVGAMNQEAGAEPTVGVGNSATEAPEATGQPDTEPAGAEARSGGAEAIEPAEAPSTSGESEPPDAAEPSAQRAETAPEQEQAATTDAPEPETRAEEPNRNPKRGRQKKATTARKNNRQQARSAGQEQTS